MGEPEFLQPEPQIEEELAEVRCIDGNYSTRVVGFCWHHIHKGYLTRNLMQRHQCLEKACDRFQRIESDAYSDRFWREHDHPKEPEPLFTPKKKIAWEDWARDKVRAYLQDFPHTEVTCVRAESDGSATIVLISDAREPIPMFKTQMSRTLRCFVNVKYVYPSPEARERLLWSKQSAY